MIFHKNITIGINQKKLTINSWKDDAEDYFLY